MIIRNSYRGFVDDAPPGVISRLIAVISADPGLLTVRALEDLGPPASLPALAPYDEISVGQEPTGWRVSLERGSKRYAGMVDNIHVDLPPRSRQKLNSLVKTICSSFQPLLNLLGMTSRRI